MGTSRSESGGGGSAFLWMILAIVVVVFLPLGIAAGEEFLFGSDQFEEFIRRLGLHGTLGRIYRPVLDFIR